MTETLTKSEDRELQLTLQALERGGAGPNLGRDTLRRALEYARRGNPSGSHRSDRFVPTSQLQH